MKTFALAIGAVACAMLAACDRGRSSATDGIEQTKFPGQVTAGGLTSGQVMARTARPETNAVYGGGSPFIAGGSGGNTGGAAMGGTVAETGEGPSRGITDPTGAMQGGTKPPGDFGGPPANAPAAGVTPVGAGSASNQEGAAPKTNTGNITGGAAGTGAAGAPGAASPPGQAAKPPAAPGTLTGDK